MKLIKSYKLFLESSSISLEEKTKYLADAYWSYNFMFVRPGIFLHIDRIEFLDQLILYTLDLDSLDLTNDSYNEFMQEVMIIDLSYDMIEEIEHKYDMFKELELKSNILPIQKIKDYFSHIEDILDDYTNDLYKPILKFHKVYNKQTNILFYRIEIPNILYKGSSSSGFSINRESSDELTEKIRPELNFVKSMVSTDYPNLELGYNITYSGFDVYIRRK